MTKSDAIAFFKGNKSALARALGIDPSALFSWPGDTVPMGRQYQLQVITSGKLRANKAHAAKPRASKAGA